jgi:Na+/H+ antiporter 1
LVGASALTVRLGIATKPDAYSWRQLAGAGALAGIGFTMSLFIAGQAFPTEFDFAAAKIAIHCVRTVGSQSVLQLWNALKRPPIGRGSCHPVAGTVLDDSRRPDQAAAFNWPGGCPSRKLYPRVTMM